MCRRLSYVFFYERISFHIYGLLLSSSVHSWLSLNSSAEADTALIVASVAAIKAIAKSSTTLRPRLRPILTTLPPCSGNPWWVAFTVTEAESTNGAWQERG